MRLFKIFCLNLLCALSLCAGWEEDLARCADKVSFYVGVRCADCDVDSESIPSNIYAYEEPSVHFSFDFSDVLSGEGFDLRRSHVCPSKEHDIPDTLRVQGHQWASLDELVRCVQDVVSECEEVGEFWDDNAIEKFSKKVFDFQIYFEGWHCFPSEGSPRVTRIAVQDSHGAVLPDANPFQSAEFIFLDRSVMGAMCNIKDPEDYRIERGVTLFTRGDISDCTLLQRCVFENASPHKGWADSGLGFCEGCNLPISLSYKGGKVYGAPIYPFTVTCAPEAFNAAISGADIKALCAQIPPIIPPEYQYVSKCFDTPSFLSDVCAGEIISEFSIVEPGSAKRVIVQQVVTSLPEYEGTSEGGEESVPVWTAGDTFEEGDGSLVESVPVHSTNRAGVHALGGGAVFDPQQVGAPFFAINGAWFLQGFKEPFLEFGPVRARTMEVRPHKTGKNQYQGVLANVMANLGWSVLYQEMTTDDKAAGNTTDACELKLSETLEDPQISAEQVSSIAAWQRSVEEAQARDDSLIGDDPWIDALGSPGSPSAAARAYLVPLPPLAA